MRHLLLLGAVLLPATAIHAQTPQGIKCQGENTVEMRYCAEVAWKESNSQLERKVPKALLKQWQEAIRALCAHAYRPYRQGTVYPQLVVACDDHLNQALLKEFNPINNQEQDRKSWIDE